MTDYMYDSDGRLDLDRLLAVQFDRPAVDRFLAALSTVMQLWAWSESVAASAFCEANGGFGWHPFGRYP